MAVPNIFSNVPGGTTIPLSELDENFAYLATSPSLTSLTVGGMTTLNGGLTLTGPLTINGTTVTPSGSTGTNLLVFNTSPTLVTPILGTPQSGNLSSCTNYPIAQISGLASGVLPFLTNPNSANLAIAVTDETGSGSLVFSNNPNLSNPVLNSPSLGTPVSGSLINCTGYQGPSISGIVPVINGGTGMSTTGSVGDVITVTSPGVLGYISAPPAIGVAGGAASQLLYQTGPNTTSFVANGTTGQVLISQGSAVPQWGQINLTAAITGILPVANGGTGTNSLGTGVQAAFGNAVNLSGGLITYSSYAPAAGKQLTLNNTIGLSGVDGSLYTMPSQTANIGYLEVPPNPATAGYVTVLTDSGKQIQFVNAASTITIAANASVPYPIGTVLTFVNVTGANVSIACGDTMYLAGLGTTGTRTLATTGLATAIKTAATTWLISGSGIS